MPTNEQYDFIKDTSAPAPKREASLRSLSELANLYDINYDMDYINKLYSGATDAKYALKTKEQQQAENTFYSQTANSNATLLDTLKKAASAAIATGASRGIAGAEQVGLMMEQQQANVDTATKLAQDRTNMADEMATEKADNIVKALEYSDQIKQAMLTNASNIYAADTQYDVGALDYAAQSKNVDALLSQIMAEYDTNKNAQNLDEKLRMLGFANDEKLAKLNSNTQLEIARQNAKTYGSGGSGYSSGNDYFNWDDYQTFIKNSYNKAYASGDLNETAKWYVEMGYAENLKDAKKALQGDKLFKSNMNNPTPIVPMGSNTQTKSYENTFKSFIDSLR